MESAKHLLEHKVKGNGDSDDIKKLSNTTADLWGKDRITKLVSLGGGLTHSLPTFSNQQLQSQILKGKRMKLYTISSS